MKKLTINSPEEMGEAASVALKALTKEGGNVLALVGELGSGKTTFVKKLAGQLGVKGTVTSPTFLIIKEYGLQSKNGEQKIKRLYHIDAYRIESEKELDNLKINEMMQKPGALIVIEWANRVSKLVPENALWIHFEHGKTDNKRVVKIQGGE